MGTRAQLCKLELPWTLEMTCMIRPNLVDSVRFKPTLLSIQSLSSSSTVSQVFKHRKWMNERRRRMEPSRPVHGMIGLNSHLITITSSEDLLGTTILSWSTGWTQGRSNTIHRQPHHSKCISPHHILWDSTMQHIWLHSWHGREVLLSQFCCKRRISLTKTVR